MGNFFKKNIVRIILCIVALLIGMMLYSVTQKGYTLPTTGAIGTILNPIRNAVNTVSDKVSSSIKIFTDKKEYQDQNKLLKEENAELKNQLVEYEKTKQRLAELEDFMEIKQEHEDYKFSDPCTIIGYVTNDPFHGFIINKGSNNNISLYDPVVTSNGVVGIISELSETYSIVKTICSPELSVGAISANGKYSGIVEGEVLLSDEYMCRMIYLDKDTKLKSGDLITTSSAGNLFPPGYLIGTVKSLENMESGLSKYAVIEPAVDFKTLSSVIVITDYSGKEASNGQKN